MKIRVSKIDRSTMEEELLELFEEFGQVDSLAINEEPDPGVETFTAWLEMPYEDEAEEAITELSGERVDGRYLIVVSEADAFKADEANRKAAELESLDLEEEEIEEEEFSGPLRKVGREEEDDSSRKPPRRGGKR